MPAQVHGRVTVKPQEVYDFIKELKGQGTAPMQACKAALAEFADTPDRAYSLVHDVLGHTALYNFYTAAVGHQQDVQIYNVPSGVQQANRPQIPAALIFETIYNVPVPRLLETGEVRYVLVGDLTKGLAMEVAAYFNSHAARYLARAKKWTELAGYLGERKTFKQMFTTEARAKAVIHEVFGTVEIR